MGALVRIEMIHDRLIWMLLILYTFLLLGLGCVGAFLPCWWRHRYLCVNRRTRIVVTFAAIAVLWITPCVLWFFYSPLSVCTQRLVYSYPRDSKDFPVWESFWCSRRCSNSTLYFPKTVPQVQTLLQSHSSVRVVGAGHSSTELQCSETEGVILSLDDMCDELSIREAEREMVASIPAGCSIDWAQRQLVPLGYQLHGFGAITSQRLGGAISTSLHGQHTKSFAHNLRGVDAILANGTVVHVGAEDPTLMAWSGSMGMLGVVYKVHVRIFPLQFVQCQTFNGLDTELLVSLSDPRVVGFEAKRLYQDSQYTIRTCFETNETFAVAVEGKDSIARGFFEDNVAIGASMLFGSFFIRLPGFSRLMKDISEVASSRYGTVASVNDYRVRTSLNPHFDEEYAVPIEHCHAFIQDVGSKMGDMYLHAYMRRVDRHAGWLTWAARDSCAIRFEYYDYGRFDLVTYERWFRRMVEASAIKYDGSGHFGKPWYSQANGLLQNSPKLAAFEKYRHELDPNLKFQNAYTLEMREAGSRAHPTLPIALQDRAIIWRVSMWIAIIASVCVSVCFCCARCGRKTRQINTVNYIREKSVVQRGKELPAPKEASRRGVEEKLERPRIRDLEAARRHGKR